MRYLNRVLPCMLALGFIHGASGLHAQNNYPDKPLHWIIPYAPGGGTDVIARPIALKLGEVLGQPITYDNRGGGGGIIAGEIVAKSAPDGYTFLVGSGNTHTFPTLLNDKIGYDPVKDYAPITNFVIVPNVLVAHPSFPVKTVKELVAYGKANPNKINWASSGNGSGGHLALITFAKAAGIQIVHVPFKGAGPAVVAMLSAETHLLFANTGVFLSHIQAGKLRAIAVCALTRLPLFPNAPTMHESGFPGFESSTFYGLLAPAGTPRPIINRLHKELVKIIKSPDSIERLATVGAIPVANTPEEFAEANRREVEKWAPVIRDNQIRAD
jgi:tripartite-type tricarboxylate transporter receptor subunit TctC